MRRVPPIVWSLLLLTAIAPARAQERGAEQLHALVNGLTVTPRVLLIGARPTDANADLIAWLARGRHVQTGYLSLTRGESAPNYAGLETGATLGAVHVQEVLAARRIDGGEQFFTRAYDFGTARSATEVFERWDRNILLGDVVAVVRAFRPHVIIALARADTTDRDGQAQASALIARDVFNAALDTVEFETKAFGMPWTPLSLFEPGAGITIDSRDYDRILGRTYADIAVESRSQLRSFGFDTPPWREPKPTQLRLVTTRGADSIATSSIFAGLDTSFSRLEKDVPRLVYHMPGIRAYADSARAMLDLSNPAAVAPQLRHVVELTSAVRVLLRSCFHPARDAAASLSNTKCRPEWLDLDASIDLVQRRAGEALLIASGISFTSITDREFLARGDTANVTITVFNNSDDEVLLNDVAVTGSLAVRMLQPIRVPAHGTAAVQRQVINIAYAHPWWIWKRMDNFYPNVTIALDGVPRPAIFMRDFALRGVAVPENIRRLSDVTATITLNRTTLTASVGDVVYKTALPLLGVRDRALSGVPAVTLGFDRVLEWAQAGKPLKKQVRMTLRSFSDRPQTFTLKSAMPGGVVKIDSLPPAFTIAPRESRDLSFLVRGAPDAARYDLGLKGIATPDTFEVGFRTAQYAHLAPLHLFRDANVAVLAVDIEIPSRLSIAYVRGAGDDADIALKSLGVPTYVVNTEGLMRFDIEALSTVVIGPDAFRVDRGLITQMPRLMEFARKGGTVVVLANPDAVAQGGVLPFPIAFAQPYVEQVTREDTPVVALDAKSRLLAWPNVIREDDWKNWVGARALTVPTTADPRYATAIETHDLTQKANRNSILVATVGRGRVVYTSLTITQQISSGVPGAMRLFMNLLSAGLPVEAKVANTAAPQ